MTSRRLLLASAIALTALATPAAAPGASAVTPDLTLVTEARYDVHPSLQRVRVTVDIVATNHLRDTITRRFYFDRAYLAVLPGTRNFDLTAATGSPSVQVVRRNRDQTLLLLSFGRRLAAGRSLELQLTFDLADPGGAPTRDIRIGASLVSFPVWAYGSSATPGSRVTVAFPPGFDVHTEAGELSSSTDAGGRTTLRSGAIGAPLRFYAYMIGDRPGSYTVSERTIRVGEDDARLTIRSWPDDQAWTARVGGLFGRALPTLSELTGLPWQRQEPLVVQEAVSRTTGGYAGLFDPVEGRVEVAYYATPAVVLHEAAHAWFNGGLLMDRWANEGFASYYAIAAAKELDVVARGTKITPALRRAAIPLNAWQIVGRGSGATEDYGYAASHALARLIALRAGDDGLREVWKAAVDAEAAYQPVTGGDTSDAGSPEPIELAGGPPDWRGLLDLLEQRTGQTYDDLWTTWVVRPEEAGLLAERRAAIADYERTVEAAGDWQLPRSIRDALGAWQFDQARDLLADARGVLVRNEELVDAAAAAGLRPPALVEEMFEGVAGFGAAAAQADAELRTVEAFVGAIQARPRTPDGFQQLGLIGQRPEASIADASAAFERGDLVAALREAADARAVWLSAADIGRDRFLTGLGTFMLVVLAVAWLVARIGWRRRRRSRPDRAPMAHRL